MSIGFVIAFTTTVRLNPYLPILLIIRLELMNPSNYQNYSLARTSNYQDQAASSSANLHRTHSILRDQSTASSVFSKIPALDSGKWIVILLFYYFIILLFKY